jgi:predicted transcriptional regulator
MTMKQIAERLGLEVLAGSEGLNREVTGVYCCDLLSFAMSKAPESFVWITVMGNVNTVAVASLADVAGIVLVEGAAADADMLKKANEQQIAVLRCEDPAFETASAIHELLK